MEHLPKITHRKYQQQFLQIKNMFYYYYYKRFQGVELGMVDLQELYAKSSGYYSECAKIFVSHDTKYYDEIITKPHIQTREKYERTSHYQLNKKIQQEGSPE